MRSAKFVPLLTAFLAAVAAIPAHAELMFGHRIEASTRAPDLDTVFAGLSDSQWVGPGLEFAQLGVYSIDLTDTTITLNSLTSDDLWTPGHAFNGFSFIDVDAEIGAFTSVRLVSTNIPEMDPSRLSWSADRINIHFGGIHTRVGDYVVLEVIPEPSTILLFGAGLLGLAAATRRSKKAQ